MGSAAKPWRLLSPLLQYAGRAAVLRRKPLSLARRAVLSRCFSNGAEKKPVITTYFAPPSPKRKSLTAPAVPSLKEPLPNVPPPRALSDLEKPVTKLTTLPNGIRVATEESYSATAAAGLFVHGGSRYENLDNSGVSHLLERLAFKSTKNRSALDVTHQLDAMGASAQATTSREILAFSGEVVRGLVPEYMELMADCLLNPQYTDEEVHEGREMIMAEMDEYLRDPQNWLFELLHECAYGKDDPTLVRGLALPSLCPPDRAASLTRDHVVDFHSRMFDPRHLVVTGVSVDHDEMVRHAQKLFGHLQPKQPGGELQLAPAEYRGGMQVVVRQDDPELPKAVIDKLDKEGSFMILAFEGASFSGPDLIPLCTLQTLLGGGGSFSSGGPGKGMYSRLYANVLCGYSWVNNATAVNMSYLDSGLFGAYCTADPHKMGNMLQVISQELAGPAMGAFTKEELERAKAQLKSSILMNLESRLIAFDDVGRQVLLWGKRESSDELCAKIDKLTGADIMDAGQRLLEKPPTLVAYAEEQALKQLPAFEDLATFFRESLSAARQKTAQPSPAGPKQKRWKLF